CKIFTARAKGLAVNRLCVLAAEAGCNARRTSRRSASTARDGQRRSAPALARQNVQDIYCQALWFKARVAPDDASRNGSTLPAAAPGQSWRGASAWSEYKRIRPWVRLR